MKSSIPTQEIGYGAYDEQLILFVAVLVFVVVPLLLFLMPRNRS